MYKTKIQEYLKEKIKEGGTTQEEVAARIGRLKQNVNWKLCHQNSRFGSILLIAEGIGLSCKVWPISGKEKECAILYDEDEMLRTASQLDITTEVFQELLESMGLELVFSWRNPGDTVYMLREVNDNEKQ